jgi:hypothetical protein
MSAWTSLYSGTEAVTTTEWSLTTDTSSIAAKTDKVTAQLFLDLNALAAGDEFRLKLYDKARSGDTQRVVEQWSFAGAQARPIWVSPALMIGQGWDFTLVKVAGTDRTITWEIRAYS